MRPQSRFLIGAVLVGAALGTIRLGSVTLGPTSRADAAGAYTPEAQVGRILERIQSLKRRVTFDDEDPSGHIPVMRSDGKYHMACVDLLLVAYRAAGYDLIHGQFNPGGAERAGRTVGSHGHGGSHGRQITSLVAYLRRDPTFHFYDTPAVNPLLTAWRPSTPCKVGDMLFLHYADSSDRHSGIVTAVDPYTGRPQMVAQISPYNQDEGLVESPLGQLFNLRCRRITGYCRPASWDRSAQAPEAAPMDGNLVLPPYPTLY